MTVLNIVRSEPDDMIKKCIETFSENKEDKVVALYDENVDWAGIVDDVFSYDKVICWW
jgi:hypothetical protein